MRILVTTNYYPPHHLGGQEIEAEEIVSALRARGHPAQVLTSRHGAGPRSDDGVHRVLWPEMDLRPRRAALHFFTVRNRRRAESVRLARKVVAGFEPDAALVLGMWNIPRAVPAALEESLGDRVLYRLADYWPALPSQHVHYWRAPGRGVGKLLKRPLAALALRLLRPEPQLRIPRAVCISRATLRELRSRGIELPDAVVLHSGIDATPFVREGERRAGSDVVRFLYAGRLAEEKGLEGLLGAVARTSHEVRERLALTVVGFAGRQRLRSLEDLSRRLGVASRVRFRPQVPRDEMPALYRDHDVFLLPARWPEPLGRAQMEAMASGMPVIASAVGGIPEVVEDEDTGVLVPPGDELALVAALERMVAEPERRRRMGRAGRDRVLRHFDFDAFLERLVDLLAETSTARAPLVERSGGR